MLASPYLLYLGDVRDPISAKTARGIAVFRPERCVGQYRLPGCTLSVGLPDLIPAEAAAKGARTLVLGIANHGGYIDEAWLPAIMEALELGMDVANGLHAKLADIAPVRQRAEQLGRRLIDVRHSAGNYPVGKGKRRQGKRLLTVGTDCSIGKMYTSLLLEAEMKKQGLDAEFAATGQTGILIAGSGVPLDAVISDFISGSIEWLTPDRDPDHWWVIEGQGSLFHPSYAGVSLGLLHGAAADALVMCHEPTRERMRHMPDYPVPGLSEAMAANLAAARLTNPDARFVGIALNTQHMAPDEADLLCRVIGQEFHLPCVDPVRHGTAPIVANLPG
ncbi:MAG TPA: N-acetyltransferase DgcN [Geminicoccus sp.]|uniref:N-acetyltransferase DgcN n=1 Tax=Geminicoccus sp. TaxID=2024832 RepID=UPI002CFF4E3F|nr:N-acetyltransferase DgcN [Geminicoccus sp.]HWL67087.1 N-acetyltransferase DgcN [Geminicoccus sp.]